MRTSVSAVACRFIRNLALRGRKFSSTNKWLCSLSIAASVMLLIQRFFRQKQRRDRQFPPGPSGLPFFGSLFSAIDLPRFASYLASNYGTVSMVYIGQQPFVFLHSTDSINQVLRHKFAMDRDFKDSLVFGHVSHDSEYNVSTVTEKYWHRKRKIFQSVMISRLDSQFINAVHNKSLATHVFPSIDKCINENNGLWSSYSMDTNFIQFHFIWFASFGTFISFDSVERQKICRLLAEVPDAVGNDILIRYLSIHRFVPRSWLQRMDALFTGKKFQSHEKLVAYLEALIYYKLQFDERIWDVSERLSENMKQKLSMSKDSSIIAKLIRVHRNHNTQSIDADADGRGFVKSTKASVLNDIAVLFLGGVSTTWNTTEYALVLLAKSPETQERIYKELRGVLGDMNEDGRCWMMDTAETRIAMVIHRLHILRAFMFEVLRLSTVLPVSVPRYNRKSDIWVNATDCKGMAQRYCIPKGTVIHTDYQSAHLKDPYWKRKFQSMKNMKNVEKMDPSEMCLDVWLDAKGNFSIHNNRNRMLAFGAGKRDCAGSALAMRSLYVLFAKMLLKYKFHLSNPNANAKQTAKPNAKKTEFRREFQFVYVLNPKPPLFVSQRE